ncbi:MAG: hypothetical protein GY913_28100 [Proteobacteria bacterium]|nr:hypothetical protein [Pseudomonadota bacterium]MCP4920774.1 hypothetical protein [Pseudomonadota bacterium]
MTIRVAWELHGAGLRPSPALLEDARAHVLMSLPRSCGRLQAEELAGHFAAEYLARVQEGRYQLRPLESEPVMPRPSWRERLIEGLDPVGEVVLRLVYGDGLSLQAVERLTRVDRVILDGAREGVRSAMRCVMAADDQPTHLDKAALDRVLERVARLPAADCQGGIEAATIDGRVHAERCPRCARGVRLIRAGVLSPSELQPRPVEYEQVGVLALHLHPDARKHRKAVAEAFEPAAIRADEDALLIDLDRVADHVSILHQLALDGTPARHQIRGALLRGEGRWTRAGLIGPVGTAAVEKTRERPWGEIDSCGTLPEPLPEPPGASRWWAGAAVACLAALLAGVFSFREPPRSIAFPVAGSIAETDDSLYARFDVSDDAYLLVLARTGSEMRVLHASGETWDKATYATGAGDFDLSVQADELLVATSSLPFDDVGPVLAAAAGPEALEQAADRLLVDHVDADIFLHRRL